MLFIGFLDLFLGRVFTRDFSKSCWEKQKFELEGLNKVMFSEVPIGIWYISTDINKDI